MNPVEHHGVFDRGPSARIEQRLRRSPSRRRAVRRALDVALVGWAPLTLLAALHGAMGGPGLGVFLSDVAAQARAIAAPMLVLAEAVCARRLSEIVVHFVDSGIVSEQERPRFAAAIRSTRRLLDSALAEVGVLALAYGIVGLLFAWAEPQAHARWARTLFDDELGWTPAGYWNALVSIPLLMILLLGWLWRLLVWARFLWIASHFELRLVPSHPDRAAGLAFVGQSVRAFVPAAIAISLLVAGAVLRDQPTHRLTAGQIGMLVAATIVGQLLLACGPLVSLLRPILAARRRGIFAYGDFARRVGLAFDRTWLAPATRSEPRTLDERDFSATADLYSLVSNVYAIRPVPVEGEDLLLLIVAALVPFLPVLLATMPIPALLARLAQIML